MHAILYETRAVGTANADLRTYARMEYKTEDPLWLISQARSAARRKRSNGSLRRRLVARLRAFRRTPSAPAETDAIVDA